MQYYVVAVVVIATLSVLTYLHLTAKPSPYDDRACAGSAWKQAFPNASASSIRLFLGCLVDGMALPQPKLAFRPDDKVIDIYRSLYGGRTPLADDLECEQFLWVIEDRFGIEADKIVDDVWRDEQVTLAQIYRYISA